MKVHRVINISDSNIKHSFLINFFDDCIQLVFALILTNDQLYVKKLKHSLSSDLNPNPRSHDSQLTWCIPCVCVFGDST